MPYKHAFFVPAIIINIGLKVMLLTDNIMQTQQNNKSRITFAQKKNKNPLNLQIHFIIFVL